MNTQGVSIKTFFVFVSKLKDFISNKICLIMQRRFLVVDAWDGPGAGEERLGVFGQEEGAPRVCIPQEEAALEEGVLQHNVVIQQCVRIDPSSVKLNQHTLMRKCLLKEIKIPFALLQTDSFQVQGV